MDFQSSQGYERTICLLYLEQFWSHCQTIAQEYNNLWDNLIRGNVALMFLSLNSYSAGAMYE